MANKYVTIFDDWFQNIYENPLITPKDLWDGIALVVKYHEDGIMPKEETPSAIRWVAYEFINNEERIAKEKHNESARQSIANKRYQQQSTLVNINQQQSTNVNVDKVDDVDTYNTLQNNTLQNNTIHIEKESIREKDVANAPSTQPKVNRFVKPSVEDIRVYCEERHNKVDAQRFFDYYESNGWQVGRNKMKDWKACVRTWEKNDEDKPAPKNALVTNGEERIAIINGEKVNYNSFDPDEFFNLACKRDFN